MSTFVNAISHYLPAEIVPNSYFKTINGLDDEWISSRTGIKMRRKASEEENTNSMALKAIENGIGRYPFPITEVDLIVAATYTPYDTVYTIAHEIQRTFDITDAKCVCVTAACSSFINALEVVEGYFAMGKATKALVVGSEHNTAYNNEHCAQSGHLWGDGAVAFLVSGERYNERDAEILAIYTQSLGHVGKANESVYLHPHHGTINMPNGKDVFVNACHYMVYALEKATYFCHKTVQDITYFAPHQANQRIIANIAHRLNVPEDHFFTNIATRGNTGSPSCGIVLSENIERIQKGDLVGMTVFGGGYSCGAVLLQF